MPSLIHLNGPPGIGKSTLAARWADEHPGTLNLDIDTLHRLIGGWRDYETRSHDLLRPVAKAMAATHLGQGRDVILPQYLGRLSEVEDFQRIAHERGADFREIVLFDDRASALSRFDTRVDDSEWGVWNRDLVTHLGGEQFLGEMYDRLLRVLEDRPRAVVVRSEPGAVERAYADLVGALEPGGGPS